VCGPFNTASFEQAVQQEIEDFLRDLNSQSSDKKERYKAATERHQRTLHSAEDASFWYTIPGVKKKPALNNGMLQTLFTALFTMRDEGETGTCFGCLFGRPEYKLPCGHLLCYECIRDFDHSRDEELYPGLVVLRYCILCGDHGHENEWPLKVRLNPQLSGLRLLSLDGGGVRGIVELIVLKRIEDAIGLSMPIGEFFDFIAGTSAGKLAVDMEI
jgi:patatin-like phospholipase